MTDKTKKILFITGGVLLVVTVGAIIYSRFTKSVDNTPQGFNELIEGASKKHPAIYQWWESLPTNKQILIESTITGNMLNFMNRELSKSNPSEEALNVLRKLGYKG